MKKEKKIIHKPIQINKNTVAVIHLFNRYDHLEDIWFTEVNKYCEENYNLHEEAAEQFIEQLDDMWSPLFMIALRSKIDERLKKLGK